MKVVKQNAQYMSKKGVRPYQFIERIGRTCYKSEDKITDTSAEKFVSNLIKREHWAMLEHWNVILEMDSHVYTQMLIDMKHPAFPNEVVGRIQITNMELKTFMSANLRVFYDLHVYPINLFESLSMIYSAVASEFPFVDPVDKAPFSSVHSVKIVDEERVKTFLYNYPLELRKHITHTFLLTTDRGVSHEIVRHRLCSFAQESTRYCNYNKEGEIVVIEPFFFLTNGTTVSNDNFGERYGAWASSCELAEKAYNRIIADGGTPQEARTVLPNSLKTDIIVTATEEEWQHIINLRYHGTTGAPHPQMKELMTLVYPTICEKSEGRVG